MAAVRKAPPIGSPYREPEMTAEEAWAIKAVGSGAANAAQQGMFLKFLVAKLAEYYLPAYRDSDRDTNFALGKQFVGYVIFKTLNMTPHEIDKLPRTPPGSSSGDDGAMKDY